MEEKEKSTKLTYEQLEQLALQLQNRVMVSENKLKNIDFAAMRLSWLFKVIENREVFDTDFVVKSVSEIEDILTLEETPETETDKA